MNRFVTFRPRDINQQDPVQRISTWSMWRNRLAQFARDNRFRFACIWSRESERDTGRNEHLHVLMHVPSKRLQQFDQAVQRWADAPDEIDCRPATYRTKTTRSGKQTNVMTYVTKNSPQAAHSGKRFYQLGGPILGKRVGMSRAVAGKAQARAEVANALRRDLRLLPGKSRGKSFTSHKGGISIFTPGLRENPSGMQATRRRKIENNSNYSQRSKQDLVA